MFWVPGYGVGQKTMRVLPVGMSVGEGVPSASVRVSGLPGVAVLLWDF